MKRILVMRSGAVGDFVLTLPVLAALRERWPAAEIEVVGHPDIACLAVEAGLADKVSRWDDPAWLGLFREGDSLPPGLAASLAARDTIISFTPDPDRALEKRVRRACPGKVVVHSPLPASLPKVHATEHLLGALAPFGIEPRRRTARLALSDEQARWGASYLASQGIRAGVEPIVAIHPGSGSRKKCWPWPRFESAARSLIDQHGCRLIVTAGPADEHLLPALTLHASRVTIVTGLDLLQLASVLSHAQCCLGNDSGVTHLAAALGVPTVAVFGPTDASVWAPLGPHVTVVQGVCPTGPCSREQRAQCPRQVCLESVSPAEVLSHVLAALDRAQTLETALQS